MFKHVNEGQGIVTIVDGKGDRYVLFPGDDCTIDVKKEGNGVVVVEEQNEKIVKKEKTKLFKGDD